MKQIINKLKKYVPKLDETKQKVQAMEECGELIQAIAKELNDKPRSPENIKEEIADVLVMSFQMMIYFSSEKEIKKLMNNKLLKIDKYLQSIKEKNGKKN